MGSGEVCVCVCVYIGVYEMDISMCTEESRDNH